VNLHDLERQLFHELKNKTGTQSQGRRLAIRQATASKIAETGVASHNATAPFAESVTVSACKTNSLEASPI
jgi:hypothetical protein